MSIANTPGFVILGISAGLAFGAGALMGTEQEGVLMMVLGPAIVACDSVYRRKILSVRMVCMEKGGKILYMPAWIMGLVWTVLGVIYVIIGYSPSGNA